MVIFSAYIKGRVVIQVILFSRLYGMYFMIKTQFSYILSCPTCIGHLVNFRPNLTRLFTYFMDPPPSKVSTKGRKPSLGRNEEDHWSIGIGQSFLWGHSQHLTCALIYDPKRGFLKNTTFIIWGLQENWQPTWFLPEARPLKFPLLYVIFILLPQNSTKP